MKGANKPRNDMTRKQVSAAPRRKRKNPGKAERHGKSKVWYEVSCAVHGHKNEQGKVSGVFKVACPSPYSKRNRFLRGCPICAAV